MSISKFYSCVCKQHFTHVFQTLLCVAIITISQVSIAESSLPDIGGPSGVDLSPGKEIELGKILIAEVRRQLPIINDPELSQYIYSLGTRITSGGLNSDFPFTFLMVYDEAINAFALPGGIIVINSGLLILAEKESEVASVVAHEIAHVTQRHIARNFANAKTFSVVSALTLLGTILATAYGGGDAGTAAFITSQSALQERQLAYSRSFEKEADRVGMHLLVSANIDPQGMPDFFERMNRETQLNRGQIPEFLSSHPLTQNRIIESQDRASQYKGSFTTNTIHFDYARARAIAISANPNQMINFYRKQVKSSKQLNDTDLYIYAGVLNRAGKNKQAIHELKKIDITTDNELTIKLALAQIYLSNRQIDDAEILLSKLSEIYPRNLPVVYYYATSLIDKDQAQLALQMLEQLNTGQSNPAIYKLKAKAASKANLPWLSHESLSDYYAAHGQYGSAMEQIQLSLRSPGIDANSKARVEAKKQLLRELRQKRENFK